MVGELDGLVNEMRGRLVELNQLQEEIKKQSGKIKNMKEDINSIKKEFDNTNLKENKITQQRYKARLATLNAKKEANEKIKTEINELKLKLDEKYENFSNEFGRKLSLRKENFEGFFVLSEDAKKRRKEQIKILEDSIERDEKNGVNPKAEYLINRKKLLENYKASLDEENREKDLDKFIEIEKVLNSDGSIENKIKELSVLIGKSNEKQNAQTDPQLVSQKDSGAKLKIEPKMQSQVGAYVEPQMGIQSESNMVHQANIQDEPQSEFANEEKTIHKKSLWSRLKNAFIRGWEFIKEKFTNIVKASKKMLSDKKEKQLKLKEMSTLDMLRDMNRKADEENKKSVENFKESIQASEEAKEESEKIMLNSNKKTMKDFEKTGDEEIDALVDTYRSI